jgi:peptidyl-tRNA hydrolase, PTH1 family
MLIIYGLGNNEPKYLKTKHNIGRVIVEGLAKKLGKNWNKKDLIWSAGSSELLMAYTNGYMNESGLPLLQLIKYYKPELEDLLILVIQDDSDQYIGKAKLLPAGGTAGHRGIISINQHLANLKLKPEQIWRLKVGIRQPQNTAKSETFVLNAFSLAEEQKATQLAQIIFDNLQLISQLKINKLQEVINSLNRE